MSHSPNSPDLAVWIERIRGREMPVFARTVAALRHIIGDDRASASALAQVILKDAPMTAKVLLATNNAKKLTELRRIVAEQGLDVEVLS